MRGRERERCGLFNKVIYLTKEEAENDALHWPGQRVQKGRCIACNGYHLTKGQRGRGYGRRGR